MRALMLLFAAVLAVAAAPTRADFAGRAVVLPDASLVIRHKIVHLYGVYVPDNREFCRTTFIPASCGNRAALALRQMISTFVRCEPIEEYDDGSLGAQCWTFSKFSSGDDLGAWLIVQGFAAAGPDASYEYHVLERIALANGRGMWGFQADAISPPGRGFGRGLVRIR